MTYPTSSDVSPSQRTLAVHYNTLRSDSLRLGAVEADAVKLGTFLNRYANGVILQYLATNRLRVPYVTTKPATLMINGFMCQATANVDLASGLFTGAAATWYVFAQRVAGITTFTLTVNTSATEGLDQRIIGEVEWDGTNITNIKDYFTSALAAADYDSGWFACVYNHTYTLAHGLSQPPRLVTLFHSEAGPGTDELVRVDEVSSAGPMSPLSVDSTNIYVETGTSSTVGTCASTRRTSASGYYRVQAWK